MILLYHGIVADDAPPERSCAAQALPLGVFARHLTWIARRRRLVPLAEYLAARGKTSRIAALTFDDGLAGTFDRVEPFLRSEKVPATFFVSTAHVDSEELLWFTALDALCFEGEYPAVGTFGNRYPLRSLDERRASRRALGQYARSSGDAPAFARELLRRHPLSVRTREEYRGMSRAAIASAAAGALFEFGSHTRSHPYLPQCSPARQREEIVANRRELSAISGRPVRYFAYPGGEYDATTLSIVRDEGFDAAFATVSRRLGEARWEIERVGIYSAPLWKVAVKAAGIVPLARRLGAQIG
jgi:peptidoglycan/xylan/chitin deacetylase (PgdA/CDA1 family)